MDASGEIVDVCGGVIDPTGGVVLPPPLIYLNDILNSTQLLQTKEVGDRNLLEGIATISYDVLKPRLIQWALTGFRNAYPIHEIPMVAPPLCSDGQVRSLSDYIQFVSEKPIGDHIASLQTRLPDMTVSYAYSGHSILIVVSRPG